MRENVIVAQPTGKYSKYELIRQLAFSDREFTIESALIVAAEAHRGVTDRAGMPYILHPIRVSMQMKTMSGKMAGLLHDVIEDTEITAADLQAMGCQQIVIDTIVTVSMTEEERQDKENGYTRFIDRIIAYYKETGNFLVIELKINDINDNRDPSRIQYLKPEKREMLVQRYTKAMAKLTAC